MIISTLEDVKMGEIDTKELNNINQMNDLRKEMDEYLQKNLSEILQDDKGRNIIEKTQKTEIKVKNEIKDNSYILNNMVKDESLKLCPKKNFIEKLKGFLVRTTPFIKLAAKKILLKM